MNEREWKTGAERFTAAARQVVSYLNEHTPLGDWSVSRVAGGEQVHVHVHHVDLISTGGRVPWTDSFCHQMVRGEGHVIPDSTLSPAFAALPDSPAVRGYVGYPITDEDGSLFGIICGADAQPFLNESAVDASLVKLFSDLLSSHLLVARAADQEIRTAMLAAAAADVDALTGLMNRRSWDTIVADAQERIAAFGDLVAVAVIDLDGLKAINDTAGHEAGDDLLRRAGKALAGAAGPQDKVARYGGDEFTVLADGIAVDKLAEHFGRYQAALAEVGISGSLGYSFTGPGDRTVATAFREADAAMYSDKRGRKAS